MQGEPPSSIERALGLLELLLEQPQGAELTDLVKRLDISRSSLFVLLGTLKRLGYVEQSERRGRYRAGPRLLAWRGQATPAADLQMAFYQEAGASGISETLALALPLNNEVILVAQVESSEQVRSVYPAGYCFGPDSAPAQVLTATPTSAIRQHGYAIVRNAQSLELALPICADGQSPSAALVMNAPAFRWRKARLESDLPRLREIAARLSYRQGALRYTPWQAVMQPADIAQRQLDPKATRAFLAAPWVARLACLRPDGAPHVVPVWQEWDGAHFFVAAWQGSLWADYVLANPNVSLSVDEPWPPLRRVLARGKAAPLRDADFPGGLVGLLERLRRRYLGVGGRLTQTAWQAFRITPEAFTAWQGLPT
jgi:DNA-binding IclR family transcriptional regulator